ncbi:MAG: hypothetical protein GF330_11625, partial [Candidatus Eisenbacteria bacterium]|nr:hypothetical protein [Candidatus Eisenbacteria bacterium]
MARIRGLAWSGVLLDLLAPIGCPLCGGRLSTPPDCPRCALPDRALAVRELRSGGSGPYLVLSGGWLRGPLRRLVHAHKYRHAPGARELLVAQTCLAVPPRLRWDALVAVPSHATRCRERGGSDAVAELARGLSRALRLPLRRLLRRVRYTPPLTGRRRAE